MNQSNTLQLDIDRLIDGELAPHEVTSLLERCESEDAWRFLALGLLEAREVSGALKDLLAQPTDLSRAKPTKSNRALTWILSAACLACVGFLAGWFASGQPTVVTADQPGSNESKSPTVAQRTDTPSKARFVGYAQIHGLVGSKPRLPVIAGSDVDYEALLKEPIPVSSEMLREFRNQGLAIEATRRVMAFEFEGQRFAIPLDKFGVRYVGNEVL